MNIKELDIFYSKNNHSRSFVYQTVYVPLICAFIIGTVLLIAIPKRIKECDEQGRK